MRLRQDGRAELALAVMRQDRVLEVQEQLLGKALDPPRRLADHVAAHEHVTDQATLPSCTWPRPGGIPARAACRCRARPSPRPPARDRAAGRACRNTGRNGRPESRRSASCSRRARAAPTCRNGGSSGRPASARKATRFSSRMFSTSVLSAGLSIDRSINVRSFFKSSSAGTRLPGTRSRKSKPSATSCVCRPAG